MKKNIYLFTTIFIFLLLPSVIYADCSDEIINEFKEVEDEFKLAYEYNKETETYNIKIYNPNPEKYLYIPIDEKVQNKCTNIEENDITCEAIPADNYTFLIISTDNTCTDALKSVFLNLNNVNKYWNDPLCEGIEDFVLCDPTYDKDITYEDFVSRVETYKKTNHQKEKQESKNKDSENKVIEYISNNYQIITIMIAAAIALVLIVILIAKKAQKSRRLE